MKVIATERGYHGKLREPGDEFDVPDDHTATWFQPVKSSEPEGSEPEGSEPEGSEPEEELV